MQRLTAIVTTYNRRDFIRTCCESVLAAAGPDLDVRLIVMDNGSTDGTAELARALGDTVRVVRTEDNRNVVGVINRGFEAAYQDGAPDFILLLNDDVEFLPGAISTLLRACAGHAHAVLTPLQLSYHQRGQVDPNALARAAECSELVEDALMGRALKEVYPQRTIIGAAMLASTATWKAIGEFDELFWFTGSDDDYCNRALWLGYEVLLVPGARMYHAHGGLTSPSHTPDKASAMRSYRLRLQARYMFQLKNPEVGIARALLNLSGHHIATVAGCLRTVWLAGAWTAMKFYAHSLASLGVVMKARARHYDPAKRIG